MASDITDVNGGARSERLSDVPCCVRMVERCMLMSLPSNSLVSVWAWHAHAEHGSDDEPGDEAALMAANLRYCRSGARVLLG